LPDLRPILYVDGLLLSAIAAAMLLPMAVDLGAGHADWQVFLAASLVTGFIGAALALGSRAAARAQLGVRQAFLLTVSAWVAAASFGALPFAFSELELGVTDAFFESMSGLTTTGSTVISGLDSLPPGILLWRAILHWLGGIGIIVMALVLLPMLRIGGMQLFRMESSEKKEKARPRAAQVAAGLVVVYVALTLLCLLALRLAGMSWFEAVCHAFATLSTGGFSTSDASVGHFASPAIEWIIVVFMAAGGGTFVLYLSPWRRGRWALLHDSQMRWYVGFLLFFSALLGFWQWAVNDVGVHDAARHASFSVVSIVTTTGFAVSDYSTWGGFAQVTFFVLTFIGGCTGSTSGAIKIFRWEVLFAMAGIHIRRLLHPHGVFSIDFNRQRIPDTVVRSVLGFMVLYFFCFAVLALGLSGLGLDIVTSLTGAATAISNVGPGLGPIIGPAGNFQPLPDAAKWLLAFAMLLGRLELLTVLVLFVPAFWRD